MMFRAAGIVAFALASTVQAYASAPDKCLRWNDINTLTRVGPDEVVATTQARNTYVIKFTTECDYQRYADYYFVVEPQERLACVTAQDVFHVHNAGACRVSRITLQNERTN